MTTRTLVIVRHAKADRPSGTADFDRPLTERGHADAGAVGVWLATHGYRPDLVVCSPARRTRQTWHGVAVALEQDTAPLVRYEPQVYEAGSAQVLALLRSVADELTTVLLIGHNPTVSLLSAQLGGADEDGDGLRTSGIAVHRVHGPWGGLGPGTADLAAAHTARGGA